MKLGLLADIHEHVRELDWAIETLHDHGVERFLVLGDVFETGERIDETVGRLRRIDAEGVWGNHDLGFCVEPSDRILARYSHDVTSYMRRLKPRMEQDSFHFCHVEPWLDPHKVEEIWYFEGPPETPDAFGKCFAAAPDRVIIVGHFHQWRWGDRAGRREWDGCTPLHLPVGQPALVVCNAVFNGCCALLDTETCVLTPFTDHRPG